MSELEKIRIIYFLIGFFIGSAVTYKITFTTYRDKLNSVIREKNTEIRDLMYEYTEERK